MLNDYTIYKHIFPQNISKVCRNQQKYAKGYIWRYANDNSN